MSSKASSWTVGCCTIGAFASLYATDSADGLLLLASSHSDCLKENTYRSAASQHHASISFAQGYSGLNSIKQAPS